MRLRDAVCEAKADLVLIDSLPSITGGMNVSDNSEVSELFTRALLPLTAEGVSVLAETAEFSDIIDVDRAEASRERSQQRLTDASYDRARAEASLHRAINRLQVASGSA